MTKKIDANWGSGPNTVVEIPSDKNFTGKAMIASSIDNPGAVVYSFQRVDGTFTADREFSTPDTAENLCSIRATTDGLEIDPGQFGDGRALGFVEIDE